MKSYFIDSNFYLRLLLNNVPAQAELVRFYLNKAKMGQIEIIFLTEVLLEIAYVLRVTYSVERTVIAQVFLDLVNTPYLHLPERGIVRDVAIKYAQTNLDLVDLLLIVRAEQEGREILSFDRKISSAKFET